MWSTGGKLTGVDNPGHVTTLNLNGLNNNVNSCVAVSSSVSVSNSDDDCCFPNLDGIYVAGKVNGVDAEIVVDTGASVSLISADLFQQISKYKPITMKSSTRRLCTAEGRVIECEGEVELDLCLGDVHINQNFQVAKLYDDVLGQTCC